MEQICKKCGLSKDLDQFKIIPQTGNLGKTCKACRDIMRHANQLKRKLQPKDELKFKTCFKCNVNKPVEKFFKNSYTSNGYNCDCMECTSTYQKEVRLKKKPISAVKEGHKICSVCKEELPFENFSKSPNNKFGVHSRCRKCNAANFRIWKNEGGGKEWDNAYTKRKKVEDPHYKLKFLLRLRLSDALNRHLSGGKVGKIHSALKLIGCSIEEYKLHLEQQFLPEMTWENHGKVWEIDHILPCSSFDLNSLEEQQKCFHYSNQQPLFRTTDIAKSFGYTDHIGNRNKGDSIF